MSILSIQSHVTYGHVGNSAAVFPLQRLGFEVWPIHTVLFSNHPGYGAFKGAVTPVETVRAILAGLEEQGVLPQCRAVLSGYIGDVALGEAIHDGVETVRHAAGPETLYVCDPVMGDTDSGLYVRDDIPDFMRDRAIPACDVALPNLFELELPTGLPADTFDRAKAAARALQAKGPRLVVVTSLVPAGGSTDRIGMLLVSPDGAWLVETPRIGFEIAPNGAGDLTAALFTGKLLAGGDPVGALGETAAAVYAILDATREAGGREILVVGAQADLVHPSRRFEVTPVG